MTVIWNPNDFVNRKKLLEGVQRIEKIKHNSTHLDFIPRINADFHTDSDQISRKEDEVSLWNKLTTRNFMHQFKEKGMAKKLITYYLKTDLKISSKLIKTPKHYFYFLYYISITIL